MTGTGIVIDHINLNQQGCCFRRVTDFDPWHLACHEQLLEKCLEFIETVMLHLDIENLCYHNQDVGHRDFDGISIARLESVWLKKIIGGIPNSRNVLFLQFFLNLLRTLLNLIWFCTMA